MSFGALVAIAISETLIQKKQLQIKNDTIKEGKILPDPYIELNADEKYNASISACIKFSLLLFMISLVIMILEKLSNNINYQLLFNIIYSSSIYLLLSISIAIFYNATKFFNMVHAIAIVLPTYILYTLNIQGYGIALMIILALVSMCLSSIVISFTNQTIYLLTLKHKKVSISSMIASIGVMIILQNIISIVWGNGTKSIRNVSVSTGHEFFGAYITDIQILTIIISLCVFGLYLLFLKKSQIGLHLRAISSNIELSRITGVHINQ